MLFLPLPLSPARPFCVRGREGKIRTVNINCRLASTRLGYCMGPTLSLRSIRHTRKPTLALSIKNHTTVDNIHKPLFNPMNPKS